MNSSINSSMNKSMTEAERCIANERISADLKSFITRGIIILESDRMTEPFIEFILHENVKHLLEFFSYSDYAKNFIIIEKLRQVNFYDGVWKKLLNPEYRAKVALYLKDQFTTFLAAVEKEGPNPPIEKVLKKWLVRLEKPACVSSSAMLPAMYLTKSEKGEFFDAIRGILPFQNGFYHIKDKIFKPYTRDMRVTKCLPFDYNREIDTTSAFNLLMQIFNTKEELDNFLIYVCNLISDHTINSNVYFLLWNSYSDLQLVMNILHHTFEKNFTEINSGFFDSNIWWDYGPVSDWNVAALESKAAFVLNYREYPVKAVRFNDLCIKGYPYSSRRLKTEKYGNVITKFTFFAGKPPKLETLVPHIREAIQFIKLNVSNVEELRAQYESIKETGMLHIQIMRIVLDFYEAQSEIPICGELSKQFKEDWLKSGISLYTFLDENYEYKHNAQSTYDEIVAEYIRKGGDNTIYKRDLKIAIEEYFDRAEDGFKKRYKVGVLNAKDQPVRMGVRHTQPKK